MATEVFANTPSGTVTSGGTDAPVGGTSQAWTVNVTRAFAAASAGTQFHAVDLAAPTEWFLVTSCPGGTGSQSWTVTRGAESTTPVTHVAGFTVVDVVTASVLGTFQQAAIDTVAADFQPDGVGAAGAVGKIADSGHVHPRQPWQFLPESYGAKGDGKVFADGVTATNTTFTSATASFTSADTGKTIMINGANGATSAPLLTTITFVNSTTVTLGSAAGASATGCAFVYGTDDTAAINSAMSAAKTYALANDYFAEILFGAKIYMVAAAPTQTSTPAVQNAQIPIPYPNVNGTTRKLVISLRGVSNAGQLQYWESVVPNLQGTCLVSTQTAPSTPSVSFGEQSVIGGPSGTAGLTGSFANTKVYIDGITVWTPVLTNMYVYDFGYVSGVEWGSFSHQGFAPANNTSAAVAAHPYLADLPGVMVTQLEATIGTGCRFPMVGNNDDVCGVSYASEGILIGAIVADHFTCLRMATLYVDVGARVDLVNGISGSAHAVVIGNWSIESYNGALTCNGGGTGYCQLSIVMDTEPIGGADPVYDVNDNGNLYGVIRIGDNGARTNRRPVILNGAPNLKVVNELIGAGAWAAAPAAPTQNVAQQNTSWRDATVYVSSTASVTAVVVAGVTTGQTAASSTVIPVRVPSGKSYTVTSSGGTLTTHWVLD